MRCRCCRPCTECSRTAAKNQTCVRLACRGGELGADGSPNLPNNKCVTLARTGYLNAMSEVAPTNLSVVWSSVLLVRHASLKCSAIEHTSDYSRTHERELVDRRNADDNHAHSRAAYEQRSAPGQRGGAGASYRPGWAGPLAQARPVEAGGRATALPRHRRRDVRRAPSQASRQVGDDVGA